MRIEVHVPSHWADVALDWRDIAEAIRISVAGECKTHNDTRQLISRCYELLQGVPGEFISEALTDKNRQVIADALRLQADRFAPEKAPSELLGGDQ